MKTLQLTIKKKWFDMIENGEKIEEYRENKEYWRSRIDINDPPDEILFINGYGHDRPAIKFRCLWVSLGKGNPEWGAPEEKCFILHLGCKLET